DPATGEVQDFASRQLNIMIFSFAAFIFLSFFNYRIFVKYAPVIYVAGCVLLLIVLLKGQVGMGAQRWIAIGPLPAIQPSEMFKWAWVVIVAWIFSDLQSSSMGIKKLVIKFVWVIPPFLLVFKQPDLGTALTYIAVWGMVVCFLGVKRVIVVLAIIAAIVMIPIMWNSLAPYQQNRVLTFIEPERDPGGAGYQARQSRIAIGSGGLVGKGYLNGTQSHLKFMPERHTDFIFAVINEEFGFLGGGIIIAIFFILIMKIVYLGVYVRNPHGKIVCIGAASLILFQFYVNISMTMGIAPVVGVPLPFISYGGSSLLTFVSLLGLVNSVYIRRNEDED
ncbi:MAG: rod shape-determining protein RodA, partial [Deferribacteraceae bacterium]|nr:rod shape-determining protein RodA [Deferribacteraceae bacterium]